MLPVAAGGGETNTRIDHDVAACCQGKKHPQCSYNTVIAIASQATYFPDQTAVTTNSLLILTWLSYINLKLIILF